MLARSAPPPRPSNPARPGLISRNPSACRTGPPPVRAGVLEHGGMPPKKNEGLVSPRALAFLRVSLGPLSAGHHPGAASPAFLEHVRPPGRARVIGGFRRCGRDLEGRCRKEQRLEGVRAGRPERAFLAGARGGGGRGGVMGLRLHSGFLSGFGAWAGRLDFGLWFHSSVSSK